MHTSPVTTAGVQNKTKKSLVAEKAEPDANTKKLFEWEIPISKLFQRQMALDSY